MKRLIGLSLMIGALALLPSLASAQFLLDPLDVYEPATENHFVPGARAAGMGGAQIAAGDDGSAIWYNPALLTRIRNPEISGSLTHQKVGNTTSLNLNRALDSDLSSTGFGGGWAMFPVPTERGGLTLGLAVNRVRSFDRIFRYSPTPGWFDDPSRVGWGGGEDESGSLWAWSFGGSIEVSPRASVGLALEIYDGHDDYSLFFDSTYSGGNYHFRHSINDDYTGISGKIGATYAASNWLNLGAVIGLPASLSIDQTSDVFENGTDIDDFDDHAISSYRYTLPFSFGFGAAAMFRDLTLAGDVTYLDYTQLEYWRGFEDLSQANQTVKRYYDDVVNLSLGAEYIIRPADVRLRAGYYQRPIPFSGFPVESDPRFFTLGAGFLIDRALSIDAAFLTGTWERRDPAIGSNEEYDAQRFLLTVSYRFR